MRPVLPSGESPFVATVQAAYSDGDTLCASIQMAEIEIEIEGEAPLRLLLSRDEVEFDVAKRRRG